jgi:hypothetical protein
MALSRFSARTRPSLPRIIDLVGFGCLILSVGFLAGWPWALLVLGAVLLLIGYAME